MAGWWFSQGTPDSSIIKAEILLKVALNTITLTPRIISVTRFSNRSKSFSFTAVHVILQSLMIDKKKDRQGHEQFPILASANTIYLIFVSQPAIVTFMFN